MDGNSKAGEFDRKELFFLVAKFLEASPCQEAAKILKAELEQHKLLPKAKNWLGQERDLTYREVECRNKHVENKHLELICLKLLNLLQDHNYQRTSGLTSIVGAGATACIHHEENADKNRILCSGLHASKRCKELKLNFQQQPIANLCNLVSARQISVEFNPQVFRSPWLYGQLNKQCMILGHLAAVFCVLFDNTGRCIITGADDELVKVWSSRTGQLLATLRGHSAEVTDISLSYDNTMIASGSLDRSVRVWCAQTSAPVAVLTGHQSHVTSVQFSPAANEEYRYLASTGKDGFLCFWQWLPEQETYSSSPIKFMEKNRMGDQTLCSTFSSGGKYFVTGGTDHILRVYVCNPGPPTLEAELDGHKNRIMSVQFGNTGEGVFATGSCDAMARIWRFIEGHWTSITLEVSSQEYTRFVGQPQVTMVGWEKTDRYLITAFTPDCAIRIWDSRTGELVKKLEGHSGEVFVLEPHPSDPRILLTAGHDGLLIVWDMLAGICLKTMGIEGEDGSPASIFDCKFSPDGLMCAAVDSYGFLSLLGFGSNEDYKKHPKEQFFHTDYRPLMRDNHHYVIDEQSQRPPHLLPPPYLVDIDGHAHPIKYQEAILRLIRPVEQVKSEYRKEEIEDYDEYMKKRLACVKQVSFGFRRAREQVGEARSAGLGVATADNGGHRSGEAAGLGMATADNGGHRSGEAVGVATADNGGHRSGETAGLGVATADNGGHRSGEAVGVATADNGEHRSGEAVGVATADNGGHRSGEAVCVATADNGGHGASGGTNDINDSSGTIPNLGSSSTTTSDNISDSSGTIPNLGSSSPGFISPSFHIPVSNSAVVNGHHTVKGGHSSSHDSSVEVQGNDRRDQMEEGGASGRDDNNGTGREGGGEGERIREAVEGDIVDVEEGSQEGQNIQNMLSSLVYSLGLNEAETKRIISFWHNRTIIPPLDPAQLSSELARREQLFQEEHDDFELQNKRALVRCEPPAPADATILDKGRALRSGRTLTAFREDSTESRSPKVESSDESVNEGEVVWDYSDDYSSTDSSDISDWTAEAKIDFSTPRRKRRRRRRTSGDSDLSNDDLQDEDDGGSSQSASAGDHVKKTSSKNSKGKKKLIEDYSAYTPPSWLMQIKPHLAPYLPQVGDIVVYFHQGHRLYINAVKEERIFSFHKTKMPWQKYKLQPQEFCQVTNIRYLVGPPTLCTITLALLSSLNQSESGESGCEQRDRITFSFKYHDMDSVLDFLVLESLYKLSVRTRLEEGDRFRSLIDGKYWFGVIKEKRPFSEEYPNSYWQCCRVLWDDGATDLLSPWDMEPILDTEEDSEDALSRISELLSLQEENLKEAWGDENEPDRILRGLDLIDDMDEAYMFMEPVDLELVPNYCAYVAFPTDVGTIKERLRNGFYRRKRALLWELAQLAKNAIAFNEEDSLIVKHAQVLVQTLWKFIESPGITNPMDCYAPEPEGEMGEVDVSLSEEVVFVDTRDLPHPEEVMPATSPIKRPWNSQNFQNPYSPSSSNSSVTDDPSTTAPRWIAQAKETLLEVSEHENAGPFLEPVDITEYADYPEYVRHPMDLGTVKRNLDFTAYNEPEEFITDMQLIFSNSYLYNSNRRSQMYRITTELQSFFEDRVRDYMQEWQEDKRTRKASTDSSISSKYGNARVILTRGYKKNLESYLKGNTNSIESEGNDDPSSRSTSVSSHNEAIPLLRRHTRSMHKSNGPSSPVISEISSVDLEGFSMTLRKRGGRKRKKRGVEVLENSSEEEEEEEEEEEQEDEEELEEEEQEESVDGESEEYYRRSSRKKKGREEILRRSMRKRRKVLNEYNYYSEDEDNDLQATMMSRSGRVIKPTLKFS